MSHQNIQHKLILYMLYLAPPVHIQCLECDIYLCFFYIFQGLFKPSFLFYAAVLTHIMVLEVLAYLTLYYFGTGWLPFIVSMLLYATSQVSLNHCIRIGAVVIVWLLDLLLPRQSVLVTTKAVSSNPAHG
jgi:hypothetical protein